MSLRDRLRRRARQGGWILAGALAAILGLHELVPLDPDRGLLYWSVLVFPASYAYAMSRVACSRCGNALGTVVRPWRLHHGSVRKRVNHCPYCGVSLDEPA